MPAERDRIRSHRRGATRPAVTTRADRPRSLILTSLLATVLLGLCGGTLYGNLRATRAADAHRTSLAVDSLFAQARNAVTLEESHLRRYRAEPADPVRVAFVRAAGAVNAALEQAGRRGDPKALRAARRLLTEQRAYREAGDRLIDGSAWTDPAGDGPYRTLQSDVDAVSRTYGGAAADQADRLFQTQRRTVFGTVVGFTIGMTLVAMIWRLVLGYQRRLLANVAASQRLALHDFLTGLPNRALFGRRLQDVVDAARADPSRRLALMVLDLNGFKAVNDTLGHQAGDQLLEVAGQRLRDAVRDVDMVARLGGDEFAVVLPDVDNVGQVRLIAERINEVLRSDFQVAAGPAAVSASIGVVTGPTDAGADDLIRHADTAMYRAKARGGGVAYYDARTDREVPDRMSLFGELRALLDAGDPWVELGLYYQPQVRLSDGTVSSVEALVRWHHPGRGLLMPDEFLPLAEARGLEIRLTYHLLDAAVEQAAAWYLGGSPRVVAVNVSPRCLVDDDFVARVIAAIDGAGLPPRLLRLEISENGMMNDSQRALAALHEIHDQGVQLSIDDYGTGFSSLEQLKRIPADELKIDRSFVRDIVTDAGDQVLVRSTVAVAHAVGLLAVAEGVEDLAALTVLADLGCDFAQGYATSPAVAAADVPAACRQAEQRARRSAAASVAAAPVSAPPLTVAADGRQVVRP
jgi:diguanylate cyclase (GGDEF)-like protein